MNNIFDSFAASMQSEDPAILQEHLQRFSEEDVPAAIACLNYQDSSSYTSLYHIVLITLVVKALGGLGPKSLSCLPELLSILSRLTTDTVFLDYSDDLAIYRMRYRYLSTLLSDSDSSPYSSSSPDEIIVAQLLAAIYMALGRMCPDSAMQEDQLRLVALHLIESAYFHHEVLSGFDSELHEFLDFAAFKSLSYLNIFKSNITNFIAESAASEALSAGTRLKSLEILKKLDSVAAQAAFASFRPAGPADPEIQLEAAALQDQLKTFYLVGRAYKEGKKSFREVSKHLMSCKFDDLTRANLPVSNVSFSNNIEKLSNLFSKILSKPQITLLVKQKGLPHQFSDDAWRAWEWTDSFLRSHLAADWFGFSRTTTDD